MSVEGGGADTLSWGTIIAGVAIVVNLAWNFGNTLHTRGVAHNIRIEQRQIERWDRLRARIESSLDAFVLELKSAHAILAKASIEEDKSPLIALIDYDIVLKQDVLAKALEEADRSDCCDSTDWVLLANGPAKYGDETSWDMILTVLACAATMRNDQVQHLKRLNIYANDIELAVRQALEAQDLASSPKTKRRWSLWSGTADKN